MKKIIVTQEGTQEVDFTAEEITEKEIDVKNEAKLLLEDNNEVTAKANAKVSGNTKLLALGLSQAEATALTGFTPSED